MSRYRPLCRVGQNPNSFGVFLVSATGSHQIRKSDEGLALRLPCQFRATLRWICLFPGSTIPELSCRVPRQGSRPTQSAMPSGSAARCSPCLLEAVRQALFSNVYPLCSVGRMPLALVAFPNHNTPWQNVDDYLSYLYPLPSARHLPPQTM
jgi:hypothetical protein